MPGNRKVKIGIIGVGQIGKQHIAKYKEIPDVELVACADINENEASRVAKTNGIPDHYTDFRELLKREDIEAVDVCLHNNFHAPVSVAALKAGKNVYCEKPMAGSYCDAKLMYDTAVRLKKKLSIQLSFLFNKESKAALEIIKAGKLGEIYHGRSTGYRRRGRPYVDGYGTSSFVQKQTSGGGALYDMGVYHISNILFLMDNPKVLRVSGKTYQKTDIDPERKKLSGYNVEELGLGFVKFDKDRTMDIIEAWAIHSSPFEGSSLAGSKGGLRLSPFGYFFRVGDLDFSAVTDLDGADFRWHALRKNADAYDGPQSHWVAALQGRVKLIPTAELALNTMLIQEGIYLSEKLGREVSAAEIQKISKSTAVKL